MYTGVLLFLGFIGMVLALVILFIALIFRQYNKMQDAALEYHKLKVELIKKYARDDVQKWGEYGINDYE
jgi:hypothetical protein